MSKQAAIQAIAVILSGYPSAESFDREGFVKIAVAAIADYPDELLAYLADPKTGIVRKSKFIPTVAEMCAFMDDQWDRQRAKQQFEAREAQRKLPPPDDPVNTVQREKNLAQMAQLLSEIGGKGRDDGDRLRSKAEIRDMANLWLEANQAPTPIKLSDEAVQKYRKAAERN